MALLPGSCFGDEFFTSSHILKGTRILDVFADDLDLPRRRPTLCKLFDVINEANSGDQRHIKTAVVAKSSIDYDRDSDDFEMESAPLGLMSNHLDGELL